MSVIQKWVSLVPRLRCNSGSRNARLDSYRYLKVSDLLENSLLKVLCWGCQGPNSRASTELGLKDADSCIQESGPKKQTGWNLGLGGHWQSYSNEHGQAMPWSCVGWSQWSGAHQWRSGLMLCEAGICFCWRIQPALQSQAEQGRRKGRCAL